MYTNSVTKFLWAACSHSMLVRLRKQTLPLIMCVLLQGVAYGAGSFTNPPTASFSGSFSFTFSAADLFFLKNGLYKQPNYNNEVYLMPLFSFQVCYIQDTSTGTATVNPGIANLENISNNVKTAIRVVGNGESTKGDDIIMFLPSGDESKTVKILDIVTCFSGDKLKYNSNFKADTYSGTKIDNNKTGTLNHYTVTPVTVPASASDATQSSTAYFVYDKTTFQSGCVDDDGNSGLITIQGYAYMQDLIENPGLTYTMQSDLTIEIT